MSGVTGRKRKRSEALGESLEERVDRVCSALATGQRVGQDQIALVMELARDLRIPRYDRIRPADLCRIIRDRLRVKRQERGATFGSLPGELAVEFLNVPGVSPRALAESTSLPLFNLVRTRVETARSNCAQRAAALSVHLGVMCLDADPDPNCSLTCRAAFENNPFRYQRTVMSDALEFLFSHKGATVPAALPDLPRERLLFTYSDTRNIAGLRYQNSGAVNRKMSLLIVSTAPPTVLVGLVANRYDLADGTALKANTRARGGEIPTTIDTLVEYWREQDAMLARVGFIGTVTATSVDPTDSARVREVLLTLAARRITVVVDGRTGVYVNARRLFSGNSMAVATQSVGPQAPILRFSPEDALSASVLAYVARQRQPVDLSTTDGYLTFPVVL